MPEGSGYVFSAMVKMAAAIVIVGASVIVGTSSALISIFIGSIIYLYAYASFSITVSVMFYIALGSLTLLTIIPIFYGYKVINKFLVILFNKNKGAINDCSRVY